MSDFKILNGFNVKDATARENIEELSTNLNTANTKISKLEVVTEHIVFSKGLFTKNSTFLFK